MSARSCIITAERLSMQCKQLPSIQHCHLIFDSFSLYWSSSNCLNVSLYACLRLACGWIVWHVRKVDDGIFRRHVCEALLICYLLQALTVLRAQFTDRRLTVNWVAIALLLSFSSAYASFRFGKGGNLIKVYELPTVSNVR